MSASQSYTCPNHPEVVEDHPGTCAKCSSPLVPRTEEPLPGAEPGSTRRAGAN